MLPYYERDKRKPWRVTRSSDKRGYDQWDFSTKDAALNKVQSLARIGARTKDYTTITIEKQ